MVEKNDIEIPQTPTTQLVPIIDGIRDNRHAGAAEPK
jgi:hypothetical protein